MKDAETQTQEKLTYDTVLAASVRVVLWRPQSIS